MALMSALIPSLFEREASGTTVSLVEGIITKETYKIRSKYLFSCDGTRSQVLRESKIPLIKKTAQGLAINILVKVDLSHTVEHRMGNLY